MAAAGSSRFAVTCGLMRQYMREQQQQQQQQGAGAPRPPPAVSNLPSPPGAAEETADARTMQLFPTGAAGASQPSQERPEAQATAPLTIFYDGRVLVFEDFPAEKAKALMQLAESESSPVAPAEIVPPAAPQRSTAAAPQPPALSDMPIARKASLQRFLEKRKHRKNTEKKSENQAYSGTFQRGITSCERKRLAETSWAQMAGGGDTPCCLPMPPGAHRPQASPPLLVLIRFIPHIPSTEFHEQRRNRALRRRQKASGEIKTPPESGGFIFHHQHP